MKRRSLLLGGASLALPNIARAQSASTLKFIPYADLATLDPIATTNYAVRNHALLVFDTLYGIDDQYQPQPQMVDGHTIEDGGKRWTLTLRDERRSSTTARRYWGAMSSPACAGGARATMSAPR